MAVRRRWLFSGCCALMITASGCLCWSLSPPDPLHECCTRIKSGMTSDEAHAVLDEYGLKCSLSFGSTQGHGFLYSRPDNSDEGIVLHFGRDSIVTGAMVYPMDNDSAVQRIMRWLHVAL